MVTRALAALLVFALCARPAAADDKLADARAAMEAVRYDRARPLLVQALQAGNNTPERVAEIYRLSAKAATVLGERDVAEQYYRRWLALDPTASLPKSEGPKLLEPFVAAQAYMAAHGRLVANAHATADGIVVTIDADPLAMVAGVLGPDGSRTPIGGDHHAILATRSERIVLIDEFGNRLLEIDVTKAADPPPPAEAAIVPPVDTSVSLVRRPVTWAIPAVVFAATGVGFALAARGADRDLTEIIARSGDHVLADADAAGLRRDRDALIANIAFAVGGACAIAAVVMFVTRSDATQTALVPTAHGVAVAGWW